MTAISRRTLIVGAASFAGALGAGLGPGLLNPAVAASLKDGRWCNPTRGYTVSGGEFGTPRGGYPHAGRDLAAPRYRSIHAAAGGTVYRKGYSNVLTGRHGYGVIVSHGGGVYTFYGHMNENSPIAVGAKVRPGQRIGRVGNTGTSGYHLHFEVHSGGLGAVVEPRAWMKNRGVILGGDIGTGGPGYGWPYLNDGQSVSGVDTVKVIQHLLNHRGHGLLVDGNFGSTSGAAVRALQKKYGLVIDGDVGAKTWAKLVVTPARDATNNAIKGMQTALRKHSYSQAVDGGFGSVTYANLRAFQSAIGLVVDGSCGPKTWQALVG
ncbi:peptidoglycan-binding protein [Nocardioides jensenii]|uniref:peptidoglycan-binding protein n=1 Tax=Nocardioides jensenii TaxID=1843 RepID=UPI0008325B4B|nr:peptidoglycan-binding protein [Nocardioides jensenii]